ncbi:MAG: F0F1 ATP synthase subunit beta, partial [Anaerolineae bacterium]|nr:F0F1 ATP synthase subunit beta [Anaerolineae bacterium]
MSTNRKNGQKQRLTGRIVRIVGPVVDIAFPGGALPDIFDAVEIRREDGSILVCEVQQLLGNDQVRTVAMSTTDGLRRGMEAIATGGPIMVPVGPATLGRLFDVTGNPIDNLGPVQAELYYPIHRPAPAFEEQSTKTEMFETGIKVIDLIAPFTKGG